MEIARDEIVSSIRLMIQQKKVNITSAISLLKVGMQKAEALRSLSGKEKQDLVVDILSTIAKGADGIEGTQDDLIPSSVIAAIRAMIEHDLVASTIDIIIDATQGRIDINEAQTCLAGFASCLGRFSFSSSK